MKRHISLVIITKNAGKLLDECLQSVQGLTDEIVLVDDYSEDNTLAIAKKHNARIYKHHEKDFGKQKAFGLQKAKCEWILFLDADERLSAQLRKEIQKLSESSKFVAYKIPYQNHFLGRQINYGGENYAMIRLFKKEYAVSHPSLVHEKVEIRKGSIGKMKHKIEHYSYQGLLQMYIKFTDYAVREAAQKAKKREKSTLAKLTLYPLHMFWARFFKDKGYKDGIFRIPLDLGFSYMEFLTYFLLLFKHK